MSITILDKPINPILLARGDTIVTTSVANTLSTHAARDNKAVRDYRGNIVSYSLSNTSNFFTWIGNSIPTGSGIPTPIPSAKILFHTLRINPDGSVHEDISHMFIPSAKGFVPYEISPTDYIILGTPPPLLINDKGVVLVEPSVHGMLRFAIDDSDDETHHFEIPATP